MWCQAMTVSMRPAEAPARIVRTTTRAASEEVQAAMRMAIPHRQDLMTVVRASTVWTQAVQIRIPRLQNRVKVARAATVRTQAVQIRIPRLQNQVKVVRKVTIQIRAAQMLIHQLQKWMKIHRVRMMTQTTQTATGLNFREKEDSRAAQTWQAALAWAV